MHVTPHKCAPPLHGKYYNGSCDGGGLWGGTYDFAAGAWGVNGSHIDTTKPFRISVQFFGETFGETAAKAATATTALTTTLAAAAAAAAAATPPATLDNITTTFTQGDKPSLMIHHTDKAYLAAMASELARGQAFAMSMWGGIDPGHGSMGWLDSPPCDGAAACNKDATVVLSDLELS